MKRSMVYHGEMEVGEVEIYPEEKKNIDLKEIRISHFSQPSERCPPLAVLHTITSFGICFKMESSTSQTRQQQDVLFHLHSSCIRENKTAVMPLRGEEIHLVAMYSRNNDRPCFWGFIVASGLYNSCLTMLNLRCLGIVFDLDETLVVANTMRSFEDKIEVLHRKMNSEVNPQRISAMQAEIKRYLDDKNILKEYAENDQVVDNGKVIKIQSEIVPALSDSHQPIVRPLIRLQEKNIILTRINPQIRDTSVLVRLRPAWEDLRSYLTARGRKRFEVFVCTMAERDYALEMWRLLDPELNLINSKELIDRIVCVKSGLKKSLFNVFQNGLCHLKMALVIDDRLKVWDEKDQPQVHVVPAFAPYYAPQAEASNAVPTLCLARSVACNVRGGFFKDFDDGLLQKIPLIAYEDDIKDIPSPPDVSNYLVSEDDASASNGNKNLLLFDGMADAEVERRLKGAISASSTVPAMTTNLDPRLAFNSSLQYTMVSSSGTVPPPTAQASIVQFGNVQFPQPNTLVKPMCQVTPPGPSLHSSPAREEGEVPESELDLDTRRRLLILQHGQDTREHTSSEPPFPVRHPTQVSAPSVPSRRGWFSVEEEMGPQQLNQLVPKEFPVGSEPLHIEKRWPRHPSLFSKVDDSVSSDRVFHESHQRLPKEVHHRDDHSRLSQSLSSYHSFPGDDIPLSGSSYSNRDFDSESGRSLFHADITTGVLQEIALKCGTKVEFLSSLVANTALQFSIEAWFAGKKVGEGFGRTRREAQNKAAECSIKQLADIYMSHTKDDSGSTYGDVSGFHGSNNNGFVSSGNSLGNQLLPKESVSFSTSSDSSRVSDPRLEVSKRSTDSISALKEFCMMEGLAANFQSSPAPASTHFAQKDEVHAQVEIDGQIFGKGFGLTWEEAKMQAAKKALESLRTMFNQGTRKRHGSPRSMQGLANKRLKQEYPRTLQRIPYSARYPRNAPLVP
ncbi:RNA polymerase II C-terminal domain phosphatase-like 1 isoform X1 [Glycine soja]|uniref:protein-serine/threonine phosphatase n=1 Tax=Glycine soja TaxID=3848 RepID=A0A445GQJ1_GLYSO|nr:RNA polymerase II C-terminal domain phosphatase-like 1 isoform X1 [Glycine soja]RZB63516.1 RNA polymerase II C-terminal domain phosphatase-like 1 isoform A [Glycine soja]